MKILQAQWMQELDSQAINRVGIPSIVLMENASQGAARFFARQFPLSSFRHAIIIVGKGNNGGDGLATGRILAQNGYQVEFILLTPPDKLNPDPLVNFNIIKNLNLPYIVADQLEPIIALFQAHHPRETFIIDAIFGTGLNKPVAPGFFADVIQFLSRTAFPVAAIDIPSGLSDAFLPEEGVHVQAQVTATFHSLKTAHLYPDGNKHCGTIEIIDIGIPHHLTTDEKYFINLVEPADFNELLAPRPIDAHKGSFGHSLTICGSLDKPGAGILSSYAVLKSGAGLCTAAVCPLNRTLPVTVHPELMTWVYQEPDQLRERLLEFNAILAGPGLGQSATTLSIISLLLQQATTPLILDADALNALANHQDLLKEPRQYPVIITPHPGEFSRLTGYPILDIKKNRIGFSQAFAREYNIYVILKGHHTIIATPNGKVYVNPTGNPGMATAGSGDVLSGMITGWISQFFPRFPLDKILPAAVFLHGYAGDLAALHTGEIALTATDILHFIPQALEGLNDYQTPFHFSW